MVTGPHWHAGRPTGLRRPGLLGRTPARAVPLPMAWRHFDGGKGCNVFIEIVPSTRPLTADGPNGALRTNPVDLAAEACSATRPDVGAQWRPPFRIVDLPASMSTGAAFARPYRRRRVADADGCGFTAQAATGVPVAEGCERGGTAGRGHPLLGTRVVTALRRAVEGASSRSPAAVPR